MEFAYNNTSNETTSVSSFFANKSYHPNLTVHPEHNMALAHARDFTVDLGKLHENLRLHIQAAQKHYQKAADNRCIPLPEFKISQYVFVKAWFFQTI
jgi:hypothetical protein